MAVFGDVVEPQQVLSAVMGEELERVMVIGRRKDGKFVAYSSHDDESWPISALDEFKERLEADNWT